MSIRKQRGAYTPRDKYEIACGRINKESHQAIAEKVGREPIDIYQAMRSEWARAISYAICRERGGDVRDLDLKYGGV